MCIRHFDVYKKRRESVFDAMRAHAPDSVAVFPSASIFPRNGDVDHDYRQNSDLFYLTGFDEPDSVLLLDAENRKTVLFVRARDAERERWDGPRAGVDGAKADFGADEAFTMSEFTEQLPKLFKNKKRLHYKLGENRAFDDRILKGVDGARGRGRTGDHWPTEIVDPSSIVHEMRLFKDEIDLEAMRTAARITGDGHLRAMAQTRPGMFEYEVEALLLNTFRKSGSDRVAYGSIVGSGSNATVLHYRANRSQMNDGDLLLIDAGCEYDYYASDVTRTFPVNGKFSREQQAIYELVLEAQLASINATRPGATLDEIHKKSVEVITAGLVRLGLLHGERETLIEQESYKTFYMHKTSHWLGMDVHDAGAYFVEGKHRKLEPNMVLTVEPGIYIPADCDKVPEAWRGIGVRIEDDLLVTDGEPLNLTASIPKSIEDVERACRS